MIHPHQKSKKPVIRLSSVWKIYRMGEVDVPALKGVSLEVLQGEFVAITGISGSGKSTIMNIVGCLDLPPKGTVYLDEHDISMLSESDLAGIRGKKIGFVFQQFNLIPTMSALENVMLPMEFLGTSNGDAEKRAKELLSSVGLSDKISHQPKQLSGGQQQRVAIARALANDPEIILGDEPTGNLDSATGSEVIGMLENLWKKNNKTIIIVTHDLALAARAQRTIQLKDGKIVAG